MTSVQSSDHVPIHYEFVVDESYLRLVTRAELRRRFRNVFAYVAPAFWLTLGIFGFLSFVRGSSWAIILVALNAFLLYRDTIGLLFRYPRAVAKNTPLGSVVGVGFGDRTLTQKANGVQTVNSYDLVATIFPHSGLLVLLYTDEVHTYYPADLIPPDELAQINQRLTDFHAGSAGSQ